MMPADSTVLVTAVGGDIGWSVARILRRSKRFHRIIGTDIVADQPARLVLDKIAAVPPANDPKYLDTLHNIIRAEAVDYLIPISEPEILRIYGTAATDLSPATPVLAGGQAIPVGSDKLRTIEFLRGINIQAPWTIPLEGNAPPEFPCILKDRRAWGNRSVVLIQDEESLRFHTRRRSGAILQQLLLPDDQEYTCGVFRGQTGEVRTIIFRRQLKGGVTASGMVVGNSDIERVLHAVASGLDLRGSINVQLRLTSEGPMIFEINPRFSSTVMFRDMLGFRDVLWTFDDLERRPLGRYDSPIGARIYRVFTEIVEIGPRRLQLWEPSRDE